jgi:hypothetical protein
MQFTKVGFTLAWKYKNRVRVTESAEDVSLLRYGFNYNRKQFYSTGPVILKRSTLRHDKLECLALTNSLPSLLANSGAVEHSAEQTEQAPVLLAIIRLGLECFLLQKHSSLLERS